MNAIQKNNNSNNKKWEKMKRNKRFKFLNIKQVSHGDVVYSIGNAVNSTVTVVRCQVVAGQIMVITYFFRYINVE